MSSLLVLVTTIEKITSHSNADALELAHVLGWQIVVPKGIYREDAKIVYFPIDTVLPLEVSERFGVTKISEQTAHSLCKVTRRAIVWPRGEAG